MTTKYTVQKDIFANRLKKLMSDKNETTYSLGDISNFSAATISRYTDGKMSPKIPTLSSVNPVWLMGYDVSKKLEVDQEPSITEREKELLSYYNQLNDLGKDKLINDAEDLTHNTKYCNVVDLNNNETEIEEEKDYLKPVAAHGSMTDKNMIDPRDLALGKKKKLQKR